MDEKILDISWKTILKISIAIACFYVLFLVRDVLIWFIFALTISILANPAVEFLQKRKVPRTLGVILIYVAVLGVLGFLIYLMIPLFVSELKLFVGYLPQYFENVSPLFQGLGFKAFENIGIFVKSASQFLEGMADNIFSVLHYSPGSRLAETMSPIDYFRFQDPRLLLLALYLKAKGAQLDKDSTESISFVHLINGRILAELYCQALKVINTLPKDSFDLAAALDHKTVSHKTLKRLARQLGFWRGRRLLAELDQIFNRLWANKKALTKEFAVRMLEERLPAIPESQSLKDAFMQVLRNRGLL